MAKTMTPIGNKILVRRDEAIKETEAGIIVPHSNKNLPKIGTVVAVGEGIRTPTGVLVPFTVKVGDRVLFSSQRVGVEVEIEKQKLMVMTEDELLGILD